MALFKRDPVKRLRRAYRQKMESAMHAIRNGDVRENARLVVEAEKLKAEIEQAESAAR